MKAKVCLIDKDNREDLEKGLLIPSKIKVSLYKIKYLYKTKRGHLRETSIKTLADDATDAKIKVLDYIEEVNKKYPYKTVSNVSILDAKLIGTYEVSLSE